VLSLTECICAESPAAAAGGAPAALFPVSSSDEPPRSPGLLPVVSAADDRDSVSLLPNVRERQITKQTSEADQEGEGICAGNCVSTASAVPEPEVSADDDGVVVAHEGWLQKKTTSKPHRWQLRYFALVVKTENEGTMVTRTLQYYHGPEKVRTPSHHLTNELQVPLLSIPLPPERLITPYDGVVMKLKLKLRLRPEFMEPSKGADKVYCFQARDSSELAAWVLALQVGDRSQRAASV
jgi:hypothetical protein